MPSLITISYIFVALSTLFTTTTTALPTDLTFPSLPNLAVYIRGPDNSYSPSLTRAESIRYNTVSHNLTLSKRNSATVQSCLTTSCTQCRTIFNGNFTVNSACIPAANTACLIITNAKTASFEFWDKAGCLGSATTLSGCGSVGSLKSVPETQSISVRVGC